MKTSLARYCAQPSARLRGLYPRHCWESWKEHQYRRLYLSRRVLCRECRYGCHQLGRGDTKPNRVPATAEDRKSVVLGQSVSVRVDLGGRRIIKKKKRKD